jgi:hypothetical protein
VVGRAIVRLLVIGVPLIAGCTLLVDAEEISEGCAKGEKECGGFCVSKTDPEYGCGEETCQPCTLPNATSVCSPSGQCFVASCRDAYDDCNKRSSDGCEVNTDTDPLHCGSCDAEPCAVAGALPACANGECAIRKCQPGYKDCNRMSDDGCETPVYDDAANCGDCELDCDAGTACAAGECRAP